MPKIDARLITKLEELVTGHRDLGTHVNDHGQLISSDDRAACRGWITTALATVESICPESSAYRKTVRQLSEDKRSAGLFIYESVQEIASILHNLVADARSGLLANFGDTVRAETFVEFLEHGRAYLRDKRTMESGVIVGVLFEDTVRRICEKNGIPQSGEKLDDLISELQKSGKLTPVQAKRSRVGADVRTKGDACSMGPVPIR